jgi:hypothetical protein
MPAEVPFQSGTADKGTFKVIGNRFTIPQEFAEKSCSARVFDISGKLLYRGIAKNGVVDIPKNIGKGNQVFIVSIAPN